MQRWDTAHQLIVNYRTKEKGTAVRIYQPNTKTYLDLGPLTPSSGFTDETFSLTPWALQMFHDNVPVESEILTYVSFVGGMSDIHSFKIQSKEKTLKEVILGNQHSELQLGIHVYGPETNENANDWSVKHQLY